MSQIQVVQPGQLRSRVNRRPNFPMLGTLRPFGLYPLMFHPVLPGETLQSYSAKFRLLSQPINNPMVGAWAEMWLVYVKLTDIDPALSEMFISETFATTGYTRAAASEALFTAAGQIDWVGMALNKFHADYMLNQGETAKTLGDVPLMRRKSMDWMQNLMFTPATGVDVNALPSDPDAQLTGFDMMNMMGMSELTYEQYLTSYGVSSARLPNGQCEILRYAPSWTLPTNHVDPATGSPSSAWSWSVDMKADKPKMFAEPGFIMLVASVRPKVYDVRKVASFAGNLWGFADWFPVYNLTDPAGGIRELKSDDLIWHPTIRGGLTLLSMLYDHRDLLSHGETFINDTVNVPYTTPAGPAAAALAGTESPEDLRGEYLSSTEIDALFKGAAAPAQRLYYEGMANAVISGHIKDTTR